MGRLRRSELGQPEVNLGLIYGAGGNIEASVLVGLEKALENVVLGLKFEKGEEKEGKGFGLVISSLTTENPEG